MDQKIQNILALRYYLVKDENGADIEKAAYYNTYLLSNFGIVVDKPELLTANHVELISNIFKLNVPNSFYKNPQDTKYFSKDELLIEQIVSYIAVELSGVTNEETYFDRIELFKKDLPEYVIGDELVLRKFHIIDEKEANTILCDIMDKYCSYTRPFGLQEKDEFKHLFKDYYKDQEIKCKDNIIEVLSLDPSLARFLDKKDLVKLSISIFGEHEDLSKRVIYQSNRLLEINEYLKYIHDCPLSKKQAKYFNKLVALCNKSNIHPKATNEKSPDRLAMKALKNGDVIKAANIYANNGSMLERRLRFLLSRSTSEQAVEILSMLPDKNPIVLAQLLLSLNENNKEKRTFTFYKNNLIKHHMETDEEQKYRKSILSKKMQLLLKNVCKEKIMNHYDKLPKLGNIYIDPSAYKIALPLNTSASGKGIDVLPTGSRIKIKGKNIRTFVYWNDAFDIDASLLVIKDFENIAKVDFTNYSQKLYAEDILFSGDVRGPKGAEYFDIKIDNLKGKGYKYVVLGLHGYASRLDEGDIFVGYMNKKDLNTKAWDPKNIAFQYQVKGDSRANMAFAIDIRKKELIVINLMMDSESRVEQGTDLNTLKRILNPKYLDFNIGLIMSYRGNVVKNIEEADVIVSTAAKDIKDNQKVINPFKTEDLVKILNE